MKYPELLNKGGGVFRELRHSIKLPAVFPHKLQRTDFFSSTLLVPEKFIEKSSNG
ncbi:MAG: hypothetical protein ACQEQ0_00020 [Bacteroidota bacterium]